MSKKKPLNVIYIGDEDFNFGPRKKFAQKKIKELNVDWDNKYNASKIDLPSSIKIKFNEMYLYEQNVDIVHDFNIQRLEIPHMN